MSKRRLERDEGSGECKYILCGRVAERRCLLIKKAMNGGTRAFGRANKKPADGKRFASAR